MIQAISITNRLGASLYLPLKNPEQSGFIVAGAYGLGPPKATVNITDILGGDGGVYNSARLPHRNITVVLELDSRFNFDTMRYLLYQYVPIKQQITFTLYFDGRSVEIDGYVESNNTEIFTKKAKAVISLICPNPYFKSLEDSIIVFSGFTGGFEFPFSGEASNLEFETYESINQKTIMYPSDIPAGIQMSFYAVGDIEHDITIQNSSGEFLTILNDPLVNITGFGMITGDTLYVSTVKGSKELTLTRGENTYNVLDALDRDSTWLQLDQRVDIYSYSAGPNITDLLFNMRYRPLYEGV